VGALDGARTWGFLVKGFVIVENTVDDQVVSSAYLVVDGEAIYELPPQAVLSIGRLDTNDIVLDDYRVSREHAMIKFSGTEFTLIDLASTHGTLVNGERIDRVVVQLTDKINIVSHELNLILDLPPELLTASGRIPQIKKSRRMDRRLKFFGGLNEFALITLVQFLNQEKQSGLLLLERGQQPGPRIYIKDGEIIHVAQGEGLAELLVRQNHDETLFFYFHHEVEFPERTILEATPNYLMSLCHSIDEKERQKLNGEAERAMKAPARTSQIVPPPPVPW
jgi:pSer/pThr/pTyr-binding forkhead associated (FHA) protein